MASVPRIDPEPHRWEATPTPSFYSHGHRLADVIPLISLFLLFSSIVEFLSYLLLPSLRTVAFAVICDLQDGRLNIDFQRIDLYSMADGMDVVRTPHVSSATITQERRQSSNINN